MMGRALPWSMAVAMLAAPAIAAPPPAVPCPPPAPQLFISPMGEPFRAAGGAAPPLDAWFAAADANHDGRLTAAEMAADADRLFTRLDSDANGEIAPTELADYENRIAPEIRLYQSTGWPGAGPAAGRKPRSRGRDADDYDGLLGAGRYTWLNIPEPVAAADLDMNRGVTRAEFRSAALARFRLLDKAAAGALTLATLPPLPSRAVPCPAPDGRRPRR